MVGRFAATKKHGKGEIIIREGTVADTFYIIRKGKVAITKKFEDGEEMVLAVQNDGEFFGEMALLDEGPRSASAVALESTVLLEITRGDFSILLKKAPLLKNALNSTIALLKESMVLNGRKPTFPSADHERLCRHGREI